MTWSAVGSWLGSNAANLSTNNQAVGNLLIVEVINLSNSTVWCTGLSGGGATWTQAGNKFSGTTNAFSAAIFLGKVTTTGAGTVTPTWSGTAPANFSMAGNEFHSTVGAWAFDKQANLDSAGTSNWPSLTASFGAGELYFGFCADITTAAAGSTSGYVYNANVDAVGNGAAYNVNCPATATFPVWGDAQQGLGIVIMVTETTFVSSALAVLPLLPPGWFPGSAAVTQDPGGIPFYSEPPPTDATPAIVIPPTPEAAPILSPPLPPGWFPGADWVTTEPGGIPFLAQPAPADPSQAVLPPPAPDILGIPEWLPLPPNWFPGSQNVTVDPGGIPFYPQPVPLLPPVPPPPPPTITGLAGSGLTGYFHDQFGKPRILWLEQGWALAYNAGRWNGGNWQSDMDAYFTARASQGFTGWYGTAWSDLHIDSTVQTGGRNAAGVYPLLVNGTAGVITTGAETIALNDAFWTRIDYLFRSAAGNGIACFLNLGMSYDFTVVGAIWQHLSTTQATAFGAALAARYPQALYPNVFWFFGDDDDGPNDPFFVAMLNGITGAGDTRGVISNEQFTNTNSHIEFDNGTSFGGPTFFGASSATYNWVYSYDPVYMGVEDSYIESSGFTKIPPIYGDGPYYGDSTSSATRDATERRFTWWALSSGARGVNTTSGPSDLAGTPVFKWQSNAVASLTTDPNGTFITGKVPNIVKYFTGLTNWHQLIPDTGNKFITAGRGTRATSSAPGGVFVFGDTDNYVTGSITTDGTLAVIYCRAFMSITIDQSRLGAGYTATWVDPSSLATQSATTGTTYNSTPLGNNSAGDPDWVLVLQGPSTNPVPPGIPDWLPLPPNWFPGADCKVTTQPGSIPFYVQPQPTDQNAAVSNAVTANAGLATGTGTAQSPIVAIGANAGLATGTGTAQGQDNNASFDASIGANTTVATGTGTALTAADAIVGTSGLATGTGSAQSPVPQLGVNAAVAAGTGTAQAPTPAIGVNDTTGPAPANGTALNATVSTLTPAPAPPGPVIVQPPGWFPGADLVTTQPDGIPFYAQPQPGDPLINLAIAVTAPAGLATATGTALNTPVSIGVNAGLATGTGTAQSPLTSTGVNAGLATGAGAAQSPIPAVATNTTVATAAGLALPVGHGAGVGLAAATGAAQTAQIAITLTGVLAAGTGAALQPGVAISGLVVKGHVTTTVTGNPGLSGVTDPRDGTTTVTGKTQAGSVS